MLSIIIPVYNVEKYVIRCLESITKNKMNNFEVIVVNDGSTDNSKEIIEKFIVNDERITLYNKKNGGLSDARNYGLERAHGDYIMFVDSDDYISDNALELITNCIDNYNSDIIIYDFSIVHSNNETRYNKVMKDYQTGKVEKLNDYFLADVTACNKVYNIKLLKKAKFKFPFGIIYEDYASTMSLIKYNPTIYYINESLYNYYYSDNSITRNDTYKEKYEDIFKASDILYNNLIDTNYKVELENLICNHLLYLASLNFYKFDKFDKIDEVSLYIRNKFPNWRKNKYIKKYNFKKKVLMNLFYNRQYKIIKFVQKVKRKLQ